MGVVVLAVPWLGACGGVAGTGSGPDAGAASGSGGSGGTGSSGTGATSSGGTGAIGGSVATGGSGGTGQTCDASGFPSSYFLALSTVLEPTKPVVARVDISAQPNGSGGLDTHWTLQPLLWSDRKIPVGSPIVLPSITHSANGAFDADLPPISIVSEANPISHTPIDVDVSSLRGSLCGAANSGCGDFDGDLTKPIPYDLKGSTWTLTKVDSPSNYPEPPAIDCAGKLAAPVGSL